MLNYESIFFFVFFFICLKKEFQLQLNNLVFCKTRKIEFLLFFFNSLQ